MGIAPDGGLFVLPNFDGIQFDVRAALDADLVTRTAMVLKAFMPAFGSFENMVRESYDGHFDHPEITPVEKVGDKYVLELFHGSTCAFKDMALLFLPKLIRKAMELKSIHEKVLILTATSGDTGTAAINGFSDVEGTAIIVFYPSDGVSKIQKEQMIKSIGKNVSVCGVHGNFDDCQSAVKATFAKLNEDRIPEKYGFRLSSANSINIGRLFPQVAYYFTAYSDLLKRGAIRYGDSVDYVVPTGNFGDILAGYMAKKIGLPVGRLVCASNANRILTDFFQTGVYDLRREFELTSSPSMDILISSNFERLLYYESNGDTAFVKTSMEKMKSDGYYNVPENMLESIRKTFFAYACSEEETRRTIQNVFETYGYLADPHTAVALHAAEQYQKECNPKNPVVVLSTASPYKFSDAVLESLRVTADSDDIFDKMYALESISGVHAPSSLMSLKGMEVLHKDVIDKEEILSYVSRKLEQSEA